MIICLSAVGLLDFSIISLYQPGIKKSLPDPPFSIFDSNKINASDSAYQLGVSAGPASSVVYGANIVLASAGWKMNHQEEMLFGSGFRRLGNRDCCGRCVLFIRYYLQAKENLRLI
ncbi:MAG: hypothetical protein ACTHK8_12265 [Ginsengibacter sp.]